jgi:flagellar biosynthesis protein FlhG
MPDQAESLRGLFARRRPSLVVVGGSDAAKTDVAVQMARDAANGGRATILVDATPGRVAAACATSCRYELSHVAAGDLALADVVRAITPHLMLLPAARALARFDSFVAAERARLAAAFSTGFAEVLAASGFEPQVDLIVVHAEDGRAARAVEAFGRDARVVIVASEHGSSMRGAYAEMKALRQQGLDRFEIVVPRVDGTDANGIVFANLAAAARRFLEIELQDGGAIELSGPRDAQARASQSTHSTPLPEEEVSHAAIA